MKNYGEILREHRLARNLTLKEIENQTGINNANLSRWECGKVIPSINFCEQLADFYGISLDELVGRGQYNTNVVNSFNNNNGHIVFGNNNKIK